MDVLCLAPCKRKLPSGATVTHPKDWSGDVPEVDAVRWIKEGGAQRIGAVLQPGQQFTADQAAILGAVADEVLASVAAATAAAGANVDLETGEIITEADIEDEGAPEAVELDEPGAEVSAEPPLKIEDLTTEELRAIAKDKKVPRAASLGREKLIEALQALKTGE